MPFPSPRQLTSAEAVTRLRDAYKKADTWVIIFDQDAAAEFQDFCLVLTGLRMPVDGAALGVVQLIASPHDPGRRVYLILIPKASLPRSLWAALIEYYTDHAPGAEQDTWTVCEPGRAHDYIVGMLDAAVSDRPVKLLPLTRPDPNLN